MSNQISQGVHYVRTPFGGDKDAIYAMADDLLPTPAEHMGVSGGSPSHTVRLDPEAHGIPGVGLLDVVYSLRTANAAGGGHTEGSKYWQRREVFTLTDSAANNRFKTIKKPSGVKATKGAQDLAAELGVDLSSVKGTGKDGTISTADVRAATAS